MPMLVPAFSEESVELSLRENFDSDSPLKIEDSVVLVF